MPQAHFIVEDNFISISDLMFRRNASLKKAPTKSMLFLVDLQTRPLQNNPVNCFAGRESLRAESEFVKTMLEAVLPTGKERSIKNKKPSFDGLVFGGPSGTRTPDRPVMSRLL